MSHYFVDSHCHLDRINLSTFAGTIDQLMAQALQAKVKYLLCVCIHLKSWKLMADTVAAYPEVFLSCGIHPGAIKPEDLHLTVEDFAHYIADPRVIAIGETGLDYHYGRDTMREQKQLFAVQIDSAVHYHKPLIIHTREAQNDTLAILKAHEAEKAGGIMHCFTEDWSMAKKALDMGFYISFSGIITFKNSVDLHEVVRKIPLDRLLIETDAPYLAPVPFRGKTNHPALVPYVAQQVATLKELSLETVARQTAQNFASLFQLSN